MAKANIDIKELIEELDGNEFNVRSYSYGDKDACLGITCDNPMNTLMEVMEMLYDLTLSNDEEDGDPLMIDYIRLLGNPKMDNIGFNAILYWPKVGWPADVECSAQENEEQES
jgi:hypothetical protein